jgi:hypothetical protein
MSSGNEKSPPEGADNDEEEYKEEQFEQMLDKDDEEEAEEESPKGKEASSGKRDEYIDEDKMLDIAEKCFMRIAEAILGHGVNVRDAFKKHISAL